MPLFKLVIGMPKGTAVQKECPEEKSSALMGKRIGDTVTGADLGFEGYEFKITGGSDNCGFPMRADVHGTGRKRILSVKGVGQSQKAKGIRYRKTVCGDTIHEKIVQVNLKMLKQGKVPLVEPTPAAKAEKETAAA